jgi:hypothetical protein
MTGRPKGAFAGMRRDLLGILLDRAAVTAGLPACGSNP